MMKILLCLALVFLARPTNGFLPISGFNINDFLQDTMDVVDDLTNTVEDLTETAADVADTVHQEVIDFFSDPMEPAPAPPLAPQPDEESEGPPPLTDDETYDITIDTWEFVDQLTDFVFGANLTYLNVYHILGHFVDNSYEEMKAMSTEELREQIKDVGDINNDGKLSPEERKDMDHYVKDELFLEKMTGNIMESVKGNQDLVLMFGGILGYTSDDLDEMDMDKLYDVIRKTLKRIGDNDPEDGWLSLEERMSLKNFVDNQLLDTFVSHVEKELMNDKKDIAGLIAMLIFGKDTGSILNVMPTGQLHEYILALCKTLFDHNFDGKLDSNELMDMSTVFYNAVKIADVLMKEITYNIPTNWIDIGVVYDILALNIDGMQAGAPFSVMNMFNIEELLSSKMNVFLSSIAQALDKQGEEADQSTSGETETEEDEESEEQEEQEKQGPSKVIVDSELITVAEVFDLNGDGKISPREVRKVMKAHKVKPKVWKKELKKKNGNLKDWLATLKVGTSDLLNKAYLSDEIYCGSDSVCGKTNTGYQVYKNRCEMRADKDLVKRRPVVCNAKCMKKQAVHTDDTNKKTTFKNMCELCTWIHKLEVSTMSKKIKKRCRIPTK